MRYLIAHTTNAHWESGASPTPELIERVGGLLGGLAKEGKLLAGEGLRATSHGVRLTFEGGRRVVTPGPYGKPSAVPSGFVIVRVASLDEATGWASRLAGVLGDVEIDVRPVTEDWDIGLGPVPEGLTTRRYMALHAARAPDAVETPAAKAAMRRLLAEMEQAGVLLASERFHPTDKGARVAATGRKYAVTDGPFAESKEVIGGYVVVSAGSLAEAKDLALRYADVVETDEVDVRLLAED